MSEAIEKTVEIKEKPYKFRDLTAEDIAPMAAILQKINIEEFKKCFSEEMIEKIIKVFAEKTKVEGKEENAQDNTMAAAGIALFPSLLSVAQVIVTNVPKCEKEVFKFLASVSNLSVEDIKKMKLGAFMRLVVDFVKFVKEEGFADFF